MVSEGLYSDIFFFDAQNGFAAYEDGGFMTTKDGGRKWKTSTRFNDIVISVVFTSATTGFIGVYDGVDYATVESSIKPRMEEKPGKRYWRTRLPGGDMLTFNL